MNNYQQVVALVILMMDHMTLSILIKHMIMILPHGCLVILWSLNLKMGLLP